MPLHERARLALRLKPVIAEKAKEKQHSGINQYTQSLSQNSVKPSYAIDTQKETAKAATYFFSVAFLEWNEKEPCWEMRSVGTRFLEYYEEGLSEFILKWIELTDLTRKFKKGE